MAFKIDPEFLEFLIELDKKKPGIALAHYQKSIDFLIVLMGNGDCRKYSLNGIVLPGVDIILKLDKDKEKDTFAGIEIWGGIQGFLSNYYKTICGNSYENFKTNHNAFERKIHIVEILTLILEKHTPTELFERHRKRISLALREQAPMIHIPLI